jgi:acyl-CoA thioesterase
MQPEEIANFLNRDLFATGNGMRVVEVRPGYGRAEMTVEPRHMNAVGILQGGAVFTLADLAFAAACNSHGVVAVACQSDINYFRAVRTGKLTAVAEEVARTRHLSTCQVRVLDEQGGNVALFQGTAFIKGTPLPV